jgi:ubiquitin-conjugating enzyme E2 R
MSGEDASERWSPLQGVESILRSILLLLDTPEIASPANVDSGVMYRDDRKSFILKAKTDVEKSKKDIPDGFVVPKTLMEEKPVVMKEDDAFWAESEEEDGWGGSDSSGEDAEMQDFEDEELDDDDEEGGQEFEDEEDDEETPKKQ